MIDYISMVNSLRYNQSNILLDYISRLLQFNNSLDEIQLWQTYINPNNSTHFKAPKKQIIIINKH